MRDRGDGGDDAGGERDASVEQNGRSYYRRVQRGLIRNWLRLAWHVDGMTYERYLALTWVERYAVHAELYEMVEEEKPSTETPTEEGEGGGGAIRPKRLRR